MMWLENYVHHVYFSILVVPSNSATDYGFVDDLLWISRPPEYII